MKSTIGPLCFIISLLGAIGSTSETLAADVAAQRELSNSGTVGIIGGPIKGTYMKFAWDLSAALDDGYDLRVLPISGKGAVQNVEDLLFVKGIDIAITQSDVLDFYRREQVYPKIDQRIRYIAKLFNEEFHLLARDEFTTVNDLAGRRVNFGPEGSGAFMTGSLVFDALAVDVELTSFPYPIALERLRQGDIDALIQIAGAPVETIAEVQSDEGLHLMSVPADRVTGAYLPAKLTAETYPQLIKPGQSVPTIAVAAVMAAYNWPTGHPRRKKMDRFVKHFFENTEHFLEPPFHPKWHELDLAAEVPDWQRMTAVQQLLAGQ